MGKTIALHVTNNNWAIGIVKNDRSGKFAVVRVNPKNQFIVLDYRKTEADARKLANKEWLADRTARVAA